MEQKTSRNSHLFSLVSGFRHLWKAYGGWQSLLRSPFLWVAFVIVSIITVCDFTEWHWYKSCISVHPSLLGFSLGGYAVMLAFGDGKFLNIIRGSEPNGDCSPFLGTSASLAWFILCQIFALVFALIADATAFSPRPGSLAVIWLKVSMFLGGWLFFYSLLLAIAATSSVFFLSRMFDDLPTDPD
jgi:hypothetical protein